MRKKDRHGAPHHKETRSNTGRMTPHFRSPRIQRARWPDRSEVYAQLYFVAGLTQSKRFVSISFPAMLRGWPATRADRLNPPAEDRPAVQGADRLPDWESAQ
jgi:hypothetical protein